MFIAAAIYPWTWTPHSLQLPQNSEADLSQASAMCFLSPVLQPAHCAVSILRATVMQSQLRQASKLSKLCLWEMVQEEGTWLWHCPWSTSHGRGSLTTLRPTKAASNGHCFVAWHPLPVITQEAAGEVGSFPVSSEEQHRLLPYVRLQQPVLAIHGPQSSEVQPGLHV